MSLQLFHKQNIAGAAGWEEEQYILLLLIPHIAICSVQLASDFQQDFQDFLQHIAGVAALPPLGKEEELVEHNLQILAATGKKQHLNLFRI